MNWQGKCLSLCFHFNVLYGCQISTKKRLKITGRQADPPENCHLTVIKLPKTWHFFKKFLTIFWQSNGNFPEGQVTTYFDKTKFISNLVFISAFPSFICNKTKHHDFMTNTLGQIRTRSDGENSSRKDYQKAVDIDSLVKLISILHKIHIFAHLLFKGPRNLSNKLIPISI